MEEKIICQLCNKKVKNLKGLARHLLNQHKNISHQEYYNTYIDPNNDHLCEFCNKPLKFRDVSKGYRKTCGDSKCQYKAKKKSNLKTTGYENNFQNPKNVRKIRNTKLERYDDENYNNMEKNMQTKLERYDDPYYTGDNFNFYCGIGIKSQKLFFVLDKKLQEENIKVNKIQYGFIKNNKIIKKERWYNVKKISKTHKARKLDCYIKIENREINFEFDETKIHKNSIEEDLIREIEILTIKPNLEIYRIKEKYYDENFYQVIEDLTEIVKNKEAKTFYEYKNLMEK